VTKEKTGVKEYGALSSAMIVVIYGPNDTCKTNIIEAMEEDFKRIVLSANNNTINNSLLRSTSKACWKT
jgi:AAA15 family ATPase/GTPase